MSTSRVRSALGSGLFFAVAPGIVAGLVPWLLTGWEAGTTWPPLQLLGGLLIVAGAIVLVEAFARFAVEGIGTPAPVAPTQRLVVGGLYRYVRNPMYVAVGATIVGQALLLGRPILCSTRPHSPSSCSPSYAATRSRPSRGSSVPSTRTTAVGCRAGGRGFGPGAASAPQPEELRSRTWQTASSPSSSSGYALCGRR